MTTIDQVICHENNTGTIWRITGAKHQNHALIELSGGNNNLF